MAHRAMLWSALALSGLAVAPVCSAHEAAAGPAAAPATPSTAAPADLPARRAVRDKETGRLRSPTAEEAAALEALERSQGAARAAPAGGGELRMRQHANGMRSAVLGTEHLVSVQARRGADGRLVIEHANPAHDHPSPARDNRPTE